MIKAQAQIVRAGTRCFREILALTKMNWNNTMLGERDPITLRTARTVGNILRHHDSDAPVSGRYAHYM